YLLVMIFLASSAVQGQEIPVTFEFSFSNPGARSMGLGGAFAALADDATAAFANSAGLVQLLEPEVSLEVRQWSYDITFIEGGRASGEPTGVGIDTVGGLRSGSAESDFTGVSFMSLVYPSDRWSFAVYRHMWAHFDLETQINGLFGLIDDELEREDDLLARTDFMVVNYGLAGSFELAENLSIGLGVVYFQAELDSFSEEYVTTEDGFFEPNLFPPELLNSTYHSQGEDDGVTFQVGILWQPWPRWSVGGFFRQGPEMTIRVTEITGPSNDEHPPGYIEVDDDSPLHLPDIFGLGAAFRSKDGALTIGIEWDRIRYSQITANFATTIFDPELIKLDDGDELRFGLEYVLVIAKQVVALRCGGWHDPAHSLNTGSGADQFERAIFSGGEAQIHYTGGVGLVYKNLQLDLGLDFADTVKQGSLSFVYRI
ncbi:OmpP1/FadL family transporter, partial [candidate division CSSED10-310 bacterium]